MHQLVNKWNFDTLNVFVFVCCVISVIGHLLVTRHVGKQEMKKTAGLTIVFTVRVIYSLKTTVFCAVTPCNLVYFYGHLIETRWIRHSRDE